MARVTSASVLRALGGAIGLGAGGLTLLAASCAGRELPAGGRTSDGALTEATIATESPDSPSGEARDTGADGLSCTIRASDYDQSCSADSDCVDGAGGLAINFTIADYCSNSCLCAADSINKRSAAQYLADISHTPLGSGAFPLCLCPLPFPPCCRRGVCTLNCGIDSGEAATVWDAAALDGSIFCSLQNGPVDAAAQDSGPYQWCTSGQQCLMFNGGWACCMKAGGVYLCNQ
jgi:hypothetical protein